jgi:ubiquinone/menaquinone biosynthesis C-methylase UbiE
LSQGKPAFLNTIDSARKGGITMGNQSEVQKNFGRRASAYRYSSTHGDPVDLQRMIGLLNPSPEAIALDVATGGGHTAIALAGYVKKVVAVDITSEMLAEAEDAARQKCIDNIEFKAEDVHRLNFPDSEFDIVASRFAAHHFADIRVALKELCRVLKPGGKLYILDCSVIDGDEPEKEINSIEFLRDSSHQCSYSPRLWKLLLEELPLKTEHIVLYKSSYSLPQWFDRMGTEQGKRQEIFLKLHSLSEPVRILYPFGEDYITTYRIELLASS